MYCKKMHFADPVTRQIFKSADQQDCSDEHLNLYQLDVDNDKSWIELTPSITRIRSPDILKP